MLRVKQPSRQIKTLALYVSANHRCYNRPLYMHEYIITVSRYRLLGTFWSHLCGNRPEHFQAENRVF